MLRRSLLSGQSLRPCTNIHLAHTLTHTRRSPTAILYRTFTTSTTDIKSIPHTKAAPDLRHAFRHAANCVWVVTSAHDNTLSGFTATSVASVSAKPPLLSFNIGKTTSSHPVMTKSLKYAVHLLRSDQAHVAQKFASKPVEHRFADRSLFDIDEDGVPVIKNALARMSGELVNLVDAGDSLLAIGSVQTADVGDGQPLLHHSRTWISSFANDKQPEPPASNNTGASSSSTNSDNSNNNTTTVTLPKRRIQLNGFDMTCVAHQSPGLWRHPDCQAWRYKDIDYWTNLAKLLDKGGFDTLFIADVLGTYDVYGGNRNAALRSASQVPVNDPVPSIAAMAAVTKKLGFGVTVSTTYEKPYSLARRLSTLDHLTKGRVAWNVVTSYLQSAAVNLGLQQQIGHDDRYDVAEEFLEVCYKLWEQSWEDNAVQRNRQTGEFTNINRVHDIKHNGKHYQVPGIHLCEPSPQRTPVIFQAGASKKGKAFAGKHAEAVFVTNPSAEVLAKTVKGMRQACADAGRDPRSLKVFTLLTIITAPTEAEAQAKFDDYRQYTSLEGALALYGGWTGTDLSGVQDDEPLKYVENDAVRSFAEQWGNVAGNDVVWTKRLVGEFIGVGGLGPTVVGSPEKVVDELERWVEVADLDGFNLAYAITPGTFEDIVKYIVPELRKRGRMYTTEQDDALYKEGVTLRERSVGSGGRLVAETHPAYQYRKHMLDNAYKGE